MPGTPNLKGKVTQEMVRTIGTGKYAADYVPWSKISELLQEHAPGWFPELVKSDLDSYLHELPFGSCLMIRFVHLDGTVTPSFPQAVMDNRHNPIPSDKITARDFSDTHRRAICLAAAAVFGLGVELWTRDPLEWGVRPEEGEAAPAQQKTTTENTKVFTEQDFREAAIDKGLTTYAVDALLKIIGKEYGNGLKALKVKDDQAIEKLNATYAPTETPKPSKKTSPVKSASPAPTEEEDLGAW